MHRILFIFAAGGLILSTGLAFAETQRPVRDQTVRVRALAADPARDANSDAAKARAAISQGFFPVDAEISNRNSCGHSR